MPISDQNYSVARIEQHTIASIGKAERHIERKNRNYENRNVDLSRTPLNIHFKDCDDLTYQAHLDKLVEQGAISLRGLKKDAKLFDEMIFDVNSAYFEKKGGYEYAKRFYEEAYCFAEEEYGTENIVSAVMHADELNTALTDQLGHPVYHYHLHVVALPVVDKEIRWSKRCKDPALVGTIKEVVHQISHSKKWASQKVIDETGHPQMVKSYSLLQDRFFHHMRDAGYDGFDRGERGSTAEHLAVTEYKVKQEQERLAQIQEAIETAKAEAKEYTTKAADARAKAQKAQEQLNAAAPKLKNMENLARRYTDNAERVLPPSGTLESGKAYRERKAIPVFQKLITVLRGLFHEYLDLKEQFNRLNRSYHMAMSKITTLENTFDRINREKHELASEVENYNTLCRGYGTETIEAEVRRIRDQEATQKRHRLVNRNRFEMDSR